jgi:hypothetical protein
MCTIAGQQLLACIHAELLQDKGATTQFCLNVALPVLDNDRVNTLSFMILVSQTTGHILDITPRDGRTVISNTD